MKAAVKKKWLKALRSGEYVQVGEQLRSENCGWHGGEEVEGTGYCCLGVLCDISGRGEWDDYDNFLFKLPRDFRREHGIKNEAVKLSATLSADADYIEFTKGEPKTDKWGAVKNSTKFMIYENEFEGVRKYFGLTRKQTSKLMELNDGGASSFSDIADWIEKNVKED